MLKLGVIGMGRRIGHITNLLLQTGKCELTAVADPNKEEARFRICERIDAAETILDKIRFYLSAEEMMAHEKLDGIAIGTRCSLHANLAAKVIARSIPLFLEKPVGIHNEDINILEEAVVHNPDMMDKILVSFPLRMTNIAVAAKEIIDSGKIGTVSNVQAVNNVHYGRVYFKDWYRDTRETSGLWIQKTTHDFDYLNFLLNEKPLEICAVSSKQVFVGNKPPGLTCDQCPESETCPESVENVRYYANEKCANMCAFATDTGNHDSASAIIKFESGMHVVYSQNFITRKSAGKRGARLIGYKGTLEFDWVSEEMNVYMHNTFRNEKYIFKSEGSHGGGDNELARNFINLMLGREKPKATLKDGVLSLKMCLAAKQSAGRAAFQHINWTFGK